MENQWWSKYVAKGQDYGYLDKFAQRTQQAKLDEAGIYISQLCNEIHTSSDISEEERKLLLQKHLPLIMKICSNTQKTCAACTSAGKKNNYLR